MYVAEKGMLIESPTSLYKDLTNHNEQYHISKITVLLSIANGLGMWLQ